MKSVLLLAVLALTPSCEMLGLEPEEEAALAESVVAVAAAPDEASEDAAKMNLVGVVSSIVDAKIAEAEGGGSIPGGDYSLLALIAAYAFRRKLADLTKGIAGAAMEGK